MKSKIKKILMFFSRLKCFYYNFFFLIQNSCNRIRCNGILYNVKLDIQGKNNILIVGQNSIVTNTKFFVLGDNMKIIIGDSVRLKSGSLWLEDLNNQLIIGDRTTIGNVHIAITGLKKKVVIGNDCMFSSRITIRTGDSHAILNSNNEKINIEKDVIIGNHCWVGEGSTILKGVSINDNSIVGTKTLVTINVPSNSCIAGVPGRIVKENINWTIDRFPIKK